jgi:hypothetical protein
MRSKVEEKIAALEAALKTVNYQIDTLQPYFSRPQIRCWYIHRNKLSQQLKENKAMFELMKRERENRREQKLNNQSQLFQP